MVAKRKSPKVQTALKVLRLERGQTLDEVAKATRTTRSHIWALERGRVADPGVSILMALARHFGCSLDAMVGSTDAIAAGRESDPLDKLLMSRIGSLDSNKKQALLSLLDGLGSETESRRAAGEAA